MKIRQPRQGTSAEVPATQSARSIAPACLALVAAVVAVYWQVGRFGFVTYDDADYVSANAVVQRGLTLEGVKWAFTTGHAANWHPLTWLSHMLDCQFFGGGAAAHHLVNLLFHLANALLVLGILKRMTGAVWRSAFVAALFALHPLHVESVAWISERKDVLSTLFLLLTLFAYVEYVRSPNVRRYLLVVSLYALGLMAKPMLVTLPFVLLLLDYWPLGRLKKDDIRSPRPKPKLVCNSARRESGFGGWLRLILEKAPLLVLAVGSCLATYFAQKGWGALYSVGGLPLSVRLANVPISYVRYLGKMLWPEDLAIPYPYPGGWPAWQVTGAAVLLCGISVAAVAMARKRPYFLAGWLWYLGMLVPVIGFVQVGMQSMADRYTYVPLIGIFVAAVWGVKDATDTWRYQRVAVATGAIAVLAGCAALTWRQLPHWRNTEALFGHAIKVTENNFWAHYNLANWLSAVGKPDAAVAHYEAALRVRPDYARAHNHLGKALDKLGRTGEAAQHYAEAIKSGGGAEAYVSMGNSLQTAGRIEEAIAQYTEALRLVPASPDAHNSLGAALARQNKLAEAISHFQSALQANPDFLEARANLGGALLMAGRIEEAITQYTETLRLAPASPEAHNGIGAALARQNKLTEAVSHFQSALQARSNFLDARANLTAVLAQQHSVNETALKLNPDDERAHINLAHALAVEGGATEAADHYAAALKTNPANYETHFNFSLVLARAGKRDEAIAHLREALRLKPDHPAARKHLAVLTGGDVP